MDKIFVNYIPKHKQGYICGSLFSDSEIRQRLFEGSELSKHTDIEWYNPIEAPVNDKSKQPTPQDIFNLDTEKILKSSCVTADLSNRDEGQAFELGIMWMCNYLHHLSKTMTLDEILKNIPQKSIYAHLSDIRIATAHKYQGYHIPWGINAYLVGGVEQMGQIYPHFENIIEDIKERDGGINDEQ